MLTREQVGDKTERGEYDAVLEACQASASAYQQALAKGLGEISASDVSDLVWWDVYNATLARHQKAD